MPSIRTILKLSAVVIATIIVSRNVPVIRDFV